MLYVRRIVPTGWTWCILQHPAGFANHIFTRGDLVVDIHVHCTLQMKHLLICTTLRAPSLSWINLGTLQAPAGYIFHIPHSPHIRAMIHSQIVSYPEVSMLLQLVQLQRNKILTVVRWISAIKCTCIRTAAWVGQTDAFPPQIDSLLFIGLDILLNVEVSKSEFCWHFPISVHLCSTDHEANWSPAGHQGAEKESCHP